MLTVRHLLNLSTTLKALSNQHIDLVLYRYIFIHVGFFCYGYCGLRKKHEVLPHYTKPNWRSNKNRGGQANGLFIPLGVDRPCWTGRTGYWSVAQPETRLAGQGAQVRMLVHEISKTNGFNGTIFENRLGGLVRVGSWGVCTNFTLIKLPLSAALTIVQVNLHRYAHNHNGLESGWLYIVYACICTPSLKQKHKENNHSVIQSPAILVGRLSSHRCQDSWMMEEDLHFLISCDPWELKLSM